MKYGNTTSGGAAISQLVAERLSCAGIARSGRVLALGGGLQPRQGARPHRLHIGADVLEPLGARRVPAPRALAPLVDQAGLEQDPQVLGDRLAGDVEALGDVARGALALGDEPEHLATTGLGEHLEGVGHCERLHLRKSCLQARLSLFG